MAYDLMEVWNCGPLQRWVKAEDYDQLRAELAQAQDTIARMKPVVDAASDWKADRDIPQYGSWDRLGNAIDAYNATQGQNAEETPNAH